MFGKAKAIAITRTPLEDAIGYDEALMLFIKGYDGKFKETTKRKNKNKSNKDPRVSRLMNCCIAYIAQNCRPFWTKDPSFSDEEMDRALALMDKGIDKQLIDYFHDNNVVDFNKMMPIIMAAKEKGITTNGKMPYKKKHFDNIPDDINYICDGWLS